MYSLTSILTAQNLTCIIGRMLLASRFSVLFSSAGLSAIAAVLWCALVLTLSSCSLTVPPSELKPEARMLESTKGSSGLSAEATELLRTIGVSPDHLPSLESLEQSAELKRKASNVYRALLLSELWLIRSESIARASPAGSFASLLRSAEISLAALQSESCATVFDAAFNSACLRLGHYYIRATRAVVVRLQQTNWQPPTLAAARYELSLRGPNGSLFLKDWTLTLTEDSALGAGVSAAYRAGIGVTASGCRLFSLSSSPVGVCLPLSFILTFESSAVTLGQKQEEGRATAVLSVFDGYQQEQVSLEQRDFPLAADFALASAALRALPRQENQSGHLSCLSIPRADKQSVIIVGSAKRLQQQAEMLRELASDAEVRLGFSFCQYSVGKKADPRSLTNDLKLLITPNSTMNFGPKRNSVIIIALGAVGERFANSSIDSLSKDREGLRLVEVVSVASSEPEVRLAEKISKQLERIDGARATTLRFEKRADTSSTLHETTESIRRALIKSAVARRAGEQFEASEKSERLAEDNKELELSPVL
jgi:hypothetical protein